MLTLEGDVFNGPGSLSLQGKMGGVGLHGLDNKLDPALLADHLLGRVWEKKKKKKKGKRKRGKRKQGNKS